MTASNSLFKSAIIALLCILYCSLFSQKDLMENTFGSVISTSSYSSVILSQRAVYLDFTSMRDGVPYFARNAIRGNSDMFVTLTYNSLGVNSQRVRLRLTIEGQGVFIQSSNDFFPRAIELFPNLPITLNNYDLAEYFDIDNLVFSNYDKQTYLENGGLPEGNYNICFEAIDYQFDSHRPLSFPSCKNASVNLLNGPYFVEPQKDIKLDARDKVDFRWKIDQKQNSTDIYTFEVYEYNPYLKDYQLLKFKTPVYKYISDKESINLNQFRSKLEDGKIYLAFVRISDAKNNSSTYKNGGYSKSHRFGFKDPTRSISCSEELILEIVVIDGQEYIQASLSGGSDFSITWGSSQSLVGSHSHLIPYEDGNQYMATGHYVTPQGEVCDISATIGQVSGGGCIPGSPCTEGDCPTEGYVDWNCNCIVRPEPIDLKREVLITGEVAYYPQLPDDCGFATFEWNNGSSGGTAIYPDNVDVAVKVTCENGCEYYGHNTNGRVYICWAGRSCYDGDPCTINDVTSFDENGNCPCAGTPVIPCNPSNPYCSGNVSIVVLPTGSGYIAVANTSCSGAQLEWTVGDNIENSSFMYVDDLTEVISVVATCPDGCSYSATYDGNCIPYSVCDDGDPTTISYYDELCNCISEPCPDNDGDGNPDPCDDEECKVTVNITESTDILTAEVEDCSNATFEWNTGATTASIPYSNPNAIYMVTVTCDERCLVIDSYGTEGCLIGDLCPPDNDPCTGDGYYQENCSCLYEEPEAVIEYNEGVDNSPPFLTVDIDCNPIKYEWSTGETTSVIDVQETGVTYFVTVTCDKGCTYIDQHYVPEDNGCEGSVEIIATDLGNGTFNLSAQVECELFLREKGGVRNGNIEYLWNTGSTSESINVTDLSKLYTVTVTCGDCEYTATYYFQSNCKASVVFTAVPLPNNEYKLIADLNFCIGPKYFIWSTGSTDNFIIVSDLEETYSVTIICGKCSYTDQFCFVGEPCDDFSECTINDVITEDCTCKGEQIQEITFEVKEIYEEICTYSIPLNIKAVSNSFIPGTFPYDNIMLESVELLSPNGTPITLNIGSNSEGFSFPYCTKSSEPPVGCSGNANLSKFYSDLAKWLKSQIPLLANKKGFGKLKTSYTIESLNFTTDLGNDFSIGIRKRDCYKTNKIVGYEVTANADCDSISDIIWSNGETSQTIITSVSQACYTVTLTCHNEDITCVLEGVYGEDCECIVGEECISEDPCLGNGVYDENCNCEFYEISDSDGDGICDPFDICPGFDDTIDLDNDGIPDGCDPVVDCEDIDLNLEYTTESVETGACNYCLDLGQLLEQDGGYTLLNQITINSYKDNYILTNEKHKDLPICFSHEEKIIEEFSTATFDPGVNSDWNYYPPDIYYVEDKKAVRLEPNTNSYLTSIVHNIEDFSEINIQLEAYMKVKPSGFFAGLSLEASFDGGEWEWLTFWNDLEEGNTVKLSHSFQSNSFSSMELRIRNTCRKLEEFIELDNIVLTGIITPCGMEEGSVTLAKLLEKFIFKNQYKGSVSIDMSSDYCEGKGPFIHIKDSNLDFASISVEAGGSVLQLPFNEFGCYGDILQEPGTWITAEVECEDATFEWYNGSTDNPIFVPYPLEEITAALKVTAVCGNGCEVSGAFTSGTTNCVAGVECNPADPCYEVGYVDEACNCIEDESSLNDDDGDMDGILDCEDPCPGIGILLFHEEIVEQVKKYDYCIDWSDAYGKNLTEVILVTNGKHFNLSQANGFDFSYCELDNGEPCTASQGTINDFLNNLYDWLYLRGDQVSIYSDYTDNDLCEGGPNTTFILNAPFEEIIFKFSGISDFKYEVKEKIVEEVRYKLQPQIFDDCENPTILWSDGTNDEFKIVSSENVGYQITVTCNDGENECIYEYETFDSFCYVGTECDDYNECTENDVYDENCNCMGTSTKDSDGDTVPDDCDICPGHDDLQDADYDGIPDGCEDCETSEEMKLCDYCIGFPAYHISRGLDIRFEGQEVGSDLNDQINGMCIWLGDPQDDPCPNGSEDEQFLLMLNGWIHANGYEGEANIGWYQEGTHPCCPGNPGDIVSEKDNSGNRASACPILEIKGTNLEFRYYSYKIGFTLHVKGFNENNCVTVGGSEPCDDGSDCTINDQIDEHCNCVGEILDVDNDGTPDCDDICLKGPDNLDADDDGIPDACDELYIDCGDDKIPYCEYIIDRLNCAKGGGDDFDGAVLFLNPLKLQQSMKEKFLQWGTNAGDFPYPQLYHDIMNNVHSDPDGVVDFLDIMPTVSFNYGSDGALTDAKIDALINSIDCSQFTSESELLRLAFLSQILFEPVSWLTDENDNPMGSPCLHSGLSENENGILVNEDGCEVEIKVDCACNCIEEIVSDYDNDGDCDDDEHIDISGCEEPCPPENADPCMGYVLGDDCNCEEVMPEDEDNDGIPDICDVCPGFDDNQDSDGDGIADGCDMCPTGISGAVSSTDGDGPNGPGDACDDGDPCTYADYVNSDCECVGYPIDFDGDYVPDCEPCNAATDTDGDGNIDQVEWVEITVEINGVDEILTVPSCDVCPGLDDKIDENGDGIPDCLVPPYQPIGCPDGFEIVPGVGIVLTFEGEDFNIEDFPQPISFAGENIQISPAGLNSFDYLTYANIREYAEDENGVNTAYTDVIFEIPDIGELNDYDYIAISYADHQQCVLSGGEVDDVKCPDNISIVNGALVVEFTNSDDYNPDFLSFLGGYSFTNLDFDSGSLSDFELNVGDSNLSFGSGDDISIKILDFSDVDLGNIVSGSITLPNGSVCDFEGGEPDNDCYATIINEDGVYEQIPVQENDPCDDGDECTHHDKYVSTGNNGCECIGELKPDSDGDGLCDEIDPCPDDENPDNDNDGKGDIDACPCTEFGDLSFEFVNGNDIEIELDMSLVDEYASIEVTLVGGPEEDMDPLSLSYSSPLVIPNLAYGYTYTIEITGLCNTGNTNTASLEVPVPSGENSSFCGLSVDPVDLSSYTLLPSLNSGDVFRASDFDINVKSAQGSYGKFSGKGYIKIPYFEFIRINVTFENIHISNAMQMIQGEIEMNAFGLAILGDDLSDAINTGVNNILNILDDILDILNELDDILDAVDELVETTGDLVSEDTKNCLVTAAAELQALKEQAESYTNQGQEPPQQLVDDIKAKTAELEACQAAYDAELANILDDLNIVITGILPILFSEDCGDYPDQLLSNYTTNKNAKNVYFMSKNDALLQNLTEDYDDVMESLGLDASGVEDLSYQIEDEDVETEALTAANNFYEGENLYHYCDLLFAMTDDGSAEKIDTPAEVGKLLKLFLEVGEQLVPAITTLKEQGVDPPDIVTNVDIQNLLRQYLRESIQFRSYNNIRN